MGVILTILGSFMGVFVLFKYLILMEVRLDAKTFKALYEIVKTNRKFVVNEEFITDSSFPVVYNAFCSVPHAPFFYINHYERLLTAGWKGKEFVTTITCFRWSYKKLRSYLEVKLKELELLIGVPVDVLGIGGVDRIGMLKRLTGEPLLDRSVWQDIAQEIDDVFAGKKDKTGAILYGPPGNGKTSFVKYLATKHRVPIKIITFNPDFTNHDLMYMFSIIGEQCIVLFEDFDNYFDGRNCILGTQNTGIKFTFDIILNGLDGVYNTYEKVVFIMTVNDLEKVDHALKCRPSRFKYVRKFDNPSESVRSKFLPGDVLDLGKDMNLDQLMRIKEHIDAGMDIVAAIGKLRDFDHKEIQKIAYEHYLFRQEMEQSGTAEEDWFEAVNVLKG